MLEAKLKGFYNERVKRVLEARRIAITFVQTLQGDTMTCVFLKRQTIKYTMIQLYFNLLSSGK